MHYASVDCSNSVEMKWSLAKEHCVQKSAQAPQLEWRALCTWRVPASCSFRIKDQTWSCVGSSVTVNSSSLSTLCASQREVNGAPLSICASLLQWPFSTRLPWVSLLSMRKTQSCKILTLLCTHFQSITLCGWRLEPLSHHGQTGRWGEDMQSNSAVGRLPLCPTMLRWRHWQK